MNTHTNTHTHIQQQQQRGSSPTCIQQLLVPRKLGFDSGRHHGESEHNAHVDVTSHSDACQPRTFPLGKKKQEKVSVDYIGQRHTPLTLHSTHSPGEQAG